MSEEHVVRSLLSIMQRTGASYSDIAVACAVSSTTTRLVVSTGRMPIREEPRRRIEKFVAANATASKRVDLKFV